METTDGHHPRAHIPEGLHKPEAGNRHGGAHGEQGASMVLSDLFLGDYDYNSDNNDEITIRSTSMRFSFSAREGSWRSDCGGFPIFFVCPNADYRAQLLKVINFSHFLGKSFGAFGKCY